MSEPNTRGVGTYLAYLLAAVGAITLIGTAGFYHFEAGHNERVTGFSDSLWWALVTITTIGYGDIYPVTAGGRICAVFLMFSGIGALSVSTAGIAAYLVRFTSIDQLRTWGLKDHVVICGLGRMGLLMSNAFRQEHHRVLVIERDEDNPRIHACRESGAIVILGNASSPETLRRARLDHAKHLIVVCGDDGSNAEVAAGAHATVTRRGTKLGCSVHLVDRDLWHLLRKWDLAASPSLRVEFFNIFDLGARAMLGQVPPFDPPAAVGEESQAGRPASDTAVPHLLVVGSSRLAQHLVIQSVHQWRERAGTMPHRIRVTMVGEDNDAVHAALRLRCPGFDQVADFAWHSIRLQSPDFHQARFLIDDHGRISVTRVYVCLDADAPSVSAALVLLARLHTTPVPVVVRMDQDSGLARLMQAARGRPEYAHLHVFGMLERVCQPDLVMRGANEMLARALHEEYLTNQQAIDGTAGANTAAVPWDALPIDIKEQNRTEADHISATLASIGCSVSPIMDLATPPVAFTPEEIELMARLEHERWLAERRALGWTLGPRDAARKTNRNMLPWDELAEDARTLTRNTVRRLPAFLARVGLVVYREAA